MISFPIINKINNVPKNKKETSVNIKSKIVFK